MGVRLRPHPALPPAVAGGGLLTRWQDADYLFSSDAAHPDTRRLALSPLSATPGAQHTPGKVPFGVGCLHCSLMVCWRGSAGLWGAKGSEVMGMLALTLMFPSGGDGAVRLLTWLFVGEQSKAGADPSALTPVEIKPAWT